jgi:hypothetical protein
MRDLGRILLLVAAAAFSAGCQSESDAMELLCFAHATVPECMDASDLTKTAQCVETKLEDSISNDDVLVLLRALPSADDPSKIIMLRYGGRQCGLADWMEAQLEK